jgi:predicted Zn-dependent protease
VIVPPPVADAQKRANENPNDLNAQLDLALAYWNANWQKETYETIGTIIKLSGVDNRDFFVQAGDKFKSQREGWLPAATLYFQAVRSYALSGDVPNHLNESFRECLYKSADRAEAALITPFEKVSQVDEAMALVAHARNTFYTGKADQAYKLLEQAKSLEPIMREAFLLEGEFAAKQGNKDKAKLVLTPLIEDITSTPEWIRLFALQILDGIK